MLIKKIRIAILKYGDKVIQNTYIYTPKCRYI